MRPKSIKKITPRELKITWDNGHESLYALTYLRDNCPCASCAGESVLMKTYIPIVPDKNTPGRYELHNIQPVGAYAVQFFWGDGHNTGIYTWEHLLNLCPCEEHSRTKV